MSEYKKEMDFDIDNFGGQKYLKSADSIGSIILNLLFMRPGSYPSMPHLGINITSKLYSISDELDVDEIKNKLQSQCTELLPYILLGEIKVFTNNIKGQDVLIITINVESEDKDDGMLIYGFTSNKSGEVNYNYDIIKKEDLK